MITKRIFDVVAAGAALVVLSPVIAVTAVAIRFTMGSPVVFRQQRPGLDGELFEIIKFRTMKDGDAPDAERITRLGSFLRASSLDELPELLNVLRGEMSLVGPRPLLPQYLELYNPHQSRRHEVRPGITGLAQVRGRNAISWEDKFNMDVDYVDTNTLKMDIEILIETVSAVFNRDGITAEGHATMPPFLGPGEPRH